MSSFSADAEMVAFRGKWDAESNTMAYNLLTAVDGSSHDLNFKFLSAERVEGHQKVTDNTGRGLARRQLIWVRRSPFQSSGGTPPQGGNP
jgi:hypothetical protein